MRVCFVVKDAKTKKPVAGAQVVLMSTYIGQTDSRGIVCGQIEPQPVVTPVSYTVLARGYKPVSTTITLPGKPVMPFMPQPPPEVPVPVYLQPIAPQPSTPTPTPQPPQPKPPQPTYPTPQPQPTTPTPTTPTPQPTYPVSPQPSPLQAIDTFISQHWLELAIASVALIGVGAVAAYVAKKR